MNRRTFITSSLVTTAAVGAVQRSAAAGAGGKQQLLDLRHYLCPTAEKRDLVLRFFKNAAIPGLNRLDIKPVGVFIHPADKDDFSIYTLAAFPDFASYVNIGERLGQDADFVEAGREYLSTEKSDPAYVRISTQLMWSLSGYPDVKVPRTGRRIFELRTYENHNEWKARLKVEMFNKAELDIFRQVSLDGVFYGQALSGAQLPNITYMLAYSDDAEKKKSWDAFGKNADWNVLKNDERYKDTVSKIHSTMLIPADCSQI